MGNFRFNLSVEVQVIVFPDNIQIGINLEKADYDDLIWTSEWIKEVDREYSIRSFRWYEREDKDCTVVYIAKLYKDKIHLGGQGEL